MLPQNKKKHCEIPVSKKKKQPAIRLAIVKLQQNNAISLL